MRSFLFACKNSANERKNKIYFGFSRMQPIFTARRDVKIVQTDKEISLFC